MTICQYQNQVIIIEGGLLWVKPSKAKTNGGLERVSNTKIPIESVLLFSFQ